MARILTKSSSADISETENLFSIFYCVSEIYGKFRVFKKKKNQSQSLCITAIINSETGSYLNVQKAIFHATLRKTTC